MQNMCSYGFAQTLNTNHTSNFNDTAQATHENNENMSRGEATNTNSTTHNDFFSINGDRLEVFGISINIDDLIILIMLFFMFRENQVDYSIIIILALILFDQS